MLATDTRDEQTRQEDQRREKYRAACHALEAARRDGASWSVLTRLEAECERWSYAE